MQFLGDNGSVVEIELLCPQCDESLDNVPPAVAPGSTIRKCPTCGYYSDGLPGRKIGEWVDATQTARQARMKGKLYDGN
jgi:hypothetical protein